MHRLLISGFLLLATVAHAGTSFLVQNGDFSSGVSGWTASSGLFGTAGACSGPFSVQTTGATACGATLSPPFDGSSAAYASAKFNSGSSLGEYDYILSQVINVPQNLTGATLAFWATVSNSYTGSSLPAAVDFVSITAVGSSTNSVTCSVPTVNGSSPWTQYSCNVLSALTPFEGGQAEIRLVSNPFVDPSANIASLTDAVGFDDISITAQSPVPEPATWALVGGVLVMFIGARRRIRRQDSRGGECPRLA